MSFLGNTIRRSTFRRRVESDPQVSIPTVQGIDGEEVPPRDRDHLILDGEEAEAELEDLETGVHVSFSDDHLWLNNIDVHTAIGLYGARPTPQTRAYIEGLHAKLSLILARCGSSRRAHRLHEEMVCAFQLLTDVLARSPATGRFCLPAGPA